MQQFLFKKPNPLALVLQQLKSRLSNRSDIHILTTNRKILSQNLISFMSIYQKNKSFFCSYNQINENQDQKNSPNSYSDQQLKTIRDKIENNAKIFLQQIFPENELKKFKNYKENILKEDNLKQENDLNEESQIILPLDQFRKNFPRLITQERFCLTQKIFETKSRRKLYKYFFDQCQKFQIKNFIIESYKGAGKSHLLLLLYFILSQDKDFRVFYLNEAKILTSQFLLTDILLTINLMASRDLDKRIEYYDDKTIAQILAEFEQARLKGKISINKILKFIKWYNELLIKEGKRVVIIADQKNQINKEFQQFYPLIFELYYSLITYFPIQFHSTSLTDPQYKQLNKQDYCILEFDFSLTDKERQQINSSFFPENLNDKEKQKIETILNELDKNPYLISQFLKKNNNLSQFPSNHQESLSLIQKFKIVFIEDIKNDINKWILTSPNKSFQKQYKDQMKKVAAVIDFKVDPSNLSKIEYNFIDRRYIYANNEGYFGINPLATQAIKERFFVIDMVAKQLKENFRKTDNSFWGRLFHSYFLNKLKNSRNIKIKYDIVDLKNDLNLQNLTSKTSNNDQKDLVTHNLSTFQVKDFYVSNKDKYSMINIKNTILESVASQQIIIINPTNYDAEVIDFVMVSKNNLYFFQIKTGNYKKKQIISQKKDYLQSLQSYTKIFNDNLQDNLKKENFIYEIFYHFVFLILEKESSNLTNKQFLVNFLCRNTNQTPLTIHEEVENLIQNTLIKDIGIMDYFDFCDEQQAQSRDIEFENFKEERKF